VVMKLFPMLHNLGLFGMMAVSLIFLGIGCFIYKMNIDLFAAIIKLVRLSSNSQQFGEIIATNKAVTIEIERRTEDRDLRNYFRILMDYDFSVDGQTYKGGDAILTSYRSERRAVNYCRKLFPDQIIYLKVPPDEKAGSDPSNLREYVTSLNLIPLDYKPSKKNSQVSVLYDKTNPSDNCPKDDTQKSNIFAIIFWILLGSVIGSIFATLGAIMFKIFPEERYIRTALFIYPLFFTAIIPAFFIKTTLRNEENDLLSHDNEDKPISFELVIDQNNSEAHLKEQLRQQKMKYQYLLQQEK
jgi:hypothetical protein